MQTVKLCTMLHLNNWLNLITKKFQNLMLWSHIVCTDRCLGWTAPEAVRHLFACIFLFFQAMGANLTSAAIDILACIYDESLNSFLFNVYLVSSVVESLVYIWKWNLWGVVQNCWKMYQFEFPASIGTDGNSSFPTFSPTFGILFLLF